MLQTLFVQNFQTHEKLKVEFDERVTTIIGPSDMGKSTILRALRWVCLNQPQGTEFIRTGSKGTTVKLKVDGQSVTRKRGKSENTYLLNDQPPFKAFGNDVPETIGRFLNLQQINFQGQLDAPYWFSETAGEVSRQLNAIVDLSIIDRSLSAISKKVKLDQQTIKITQERLKTATEEAESLKWVEEAESDYLATEAVREAVEASRERYEDLSSLIDEITLCGQQMLEKEQCVLDAEELVKIGDEILKKEQLIGRIEQVVKQIKTQKRIIDRPLPDDKLIQGMETTILKIQEKTKEIESLQKMSRAVKEAKKLVETSSKNLEGAEVEYRELAGSPCPVCGEPLK